MSKNKTWRFHHDNELAHSALIVTEFFVKTGTSVIPQPSYYPDLAAWNFFLFPKLEKKTWKGADSIQFRTLKQIVR